MAAARLKNEYMSKVDAAWLHMNAPTNMMMITGVMMFDQPIDFQRLKATYEHRQVDRYPRFRMRVREGNLLNGPRWEEDPHFDISRHVHRMALPPPGDQAALEEMVGDLMSTPLDFDKSPWQVHLIEGFGSGCAVVTRLAHCIADGIALMQVLFDLTDAEADAPWPEAMIEYEYKPPIWTRIIVPAMAAVDSTLRLGETVVHESMETLVHPQRLLELAKAGLGAADFGTKYTLALGKLLLLPADKQTVFKGKLGVMKRAAWTKPIPLTEVKAVGKLLCGTVNDVLLSAVAGGLRRYLESRGDRTEGLSIRAMVPVNLRSEQEVGQLGNRFGLIYVTLPVGIVDIQERCYAVKRRMDVIKNTPEALVAFDILQVFGTTPAQVQGMFTSVFAMKATAVMTNVPGPRQTIYFCGVPLRCFTFWVPTSATLSLGVSIFSYDGQVTVGISTDAGLAPDPQNIVAGIEAEFREMQEYIRYPAEDNGGDNGLPMEARQAAGKAAAVAQTTTAAEEAHTAWQQAGSGEQRMSGQEEPTQHAAAAQPAVAVEVLEADEPQLEPEGQAAVAAAEAVLAAVVAESRTAPAAMCQALTKSGQPCRNHALVGGTMCRRHAGA